MKKSDHFLRKILAVLLVLAIVLPYGFSQALAASSYPHEQEIWDNEYATIKYLKIEPSIGIIGYYLYLDVQSKTGKTILVGVPESAINNYTCSIGFGSGTQITSGNSAIVMTLLPTQKNYDHLYSIQLKLDIIDDEWNHLADSGWIELDISDPENGPQPETEIDVPAPIIDNDFISISYLNVEPVEGIQSHKAVFHLTNKTSHTISVYIDQGALNGRMCASVIGSEFATMLAGNKSICPFVFNMLEDVGDLEEIQFRFHVSDEDTNKELFVSDLFKIEP